jgi:hypothetical protein
LSASELARDLRRTKRTGPLIVRTMAFWLSFYARMRNMVWKYHRICVEMDVQTAAVSAFGVE